MEVIILDWSYFIRSILDKVNVILDFGKIIFDNSKTVEKVSVILDTISCLTGNKKVCVSWRRFIMKMQVNNERTSIKMINKLNWNNNYERDLLSKVYVYNSIKRVVRKKDI